MQDRITKKDIHIWKALPLIPLVGILLAIGYVVSFFCVCFYCGYKKGVNHLMNVFGQENEEELVERIVAEKLKEQK